MIYAKNIINKSIVKKNNPLINIPYFSLNFEMDKNAVTEKQRKKELSIINRWIKLISVIKYELKTMPTTIIKIISENNSLLNFFKLLT